MKENQSKVSTQTRFRYLDFLTGLSFQKVNRLFALPLEIMLIEQDI